MAIQTKNQLFWAKISIIVAVLKSSGRREKLFLISKYSNGENRNVFKFQLERIYDFFSRWRLLYVFVKINHISNIYIILLKSALCKSNLSNTASTWNRHVFRLKRKIFDLTQFIKNPVETSLRLSKVPKNSEVYLRTDFLLEL